MKNVILDFVFPKMRKRTEQSENVVHFSDKVLSVSEIEQALVVPGEGVFSVKGEYIKGTSVHQEWPYNNDCPQCYEEVDKTVIYLGVFNSCWGHCITDNLQRLWILNEKTRFSKYKNLLCVYSCLKTRPSLPDNFFQLLDVLGIDRKRLLCLDKPTMFSKVIIPDSCFRLDSKEKIRIYTKEYRDLIDFIVNECKIQKEYPRRRVYFSRTKWQNALERGEFRIQAVFEKLGYEILYPEKLDFRQMITILSSCESFASTDGSCAHNAVFCPPGCSVTIIRKASYINEYQTVINDINSLSVTYVDANLSNILWDRNSPWS